MSNVPVSSQAGSSTLASLLERIQANDQAGWQRFEYLYGPLIFRWCRKKGLQDADAEDIRSEVYAAVTQKIRTFDPRCVGGGFRAWLWTITLNKIRDKASKANREPLGVGGSDWQKVFNDLATAPSSPEADQSLLLRRSMEIVLKDFDEKTAKAFVLRVKDNFTAMEVSERVGISTNAVYLAVRRVKARLREEFGGLLDLGRGNS